MKCIIYVAITLLWLASHGGPDAGYLKDARVCGDITELKVYIDVPTPGADYFIVVSPEGLHNAGMVYRFLDADF